MWNRPKRPNGAAERQPPEVPVGLIDAKQSGWYNGATHELLTGFPIHPEDTVIDVGCGDGMACGFVAGCGAAVIGVDVDPSKVKTVEKLFRRSRARASLAVVSNANPLPIRDAVATKVISMEVLEHVDDPSRFLSELVRVGKPGAQYLITVPDAAAETVQRGLAPPSHWKKPNHIHVFQRDELDRLVHRAGLEIQRRIHFGFYWSMWWIFRWVTEGEFRPGTPGGPLLDHWNRTWRAVLADPEGERVTRALNELMPKSQALVARKAA